MKLDQKESLKVTAGKNYGDLGSAARKEDPWVWRWRRRGPARRTKSQYGETVMEGGTVCRVIFHTSTSAGCSHLQNEKDTRLYQFPNLSESSVIEESLNKRREQRQSRYHYFQRFLAMGQHSELHTGNFSTIMLLNPLQVQIRSLPFLRSCSLYLLNSPPNFLQCTWENSSKIPYLKQQSPTS